MSFVFYRVLVGCVAHKRSRVMFTVLVFFFFRDVSANAEAATVVQR